MSETSDPNELTENQATEVLASALDEILRTARPQVAEALQLCAIPHWFDQAMIVALRADSTFSDKIITSLKRFTFVTEIAPGRFILHDNVREQILDRLRADPIRFKESNARALAEFQQRLADQKDEALVREAVFHQLVVDPPAALREVERLFDEAEVNHRLAECELLIKLLREREDKNFDDWAYYYFGRLAYSNGRLNEAREAFVMLISKKELESDLAARVRLALGRVETRFGRWLEAIAHYENCVQHFQQVHDGTHVGLATLEIANAFTDFALNAKGEYRPHYGYPLLARRLNRLGPVREPALWMGFLLRQVWYLILYFPIAVYLLWKLPGHSLLRLPSHFLWTTADLPAMRLLGRALQWYGNAEKHMTGDASRVEVKARLARLLQQFGNSRAAATLYRQLVQNPVVQANEYRTAVLKLELARSHLIEGEIEKAAPLLAHCIEVFRRYDDKAAIAQTLALQAHTKLFTDGPALALDDYRQSVMLYRALNARAPLGELAADIEQLQNRSDIPHRKELARPLLDEVGLGEGDQIFFSRRPLPIVGVIDILSIIVLVFLAILAYFLARFYSTSSYAWSIWGIFFGYTPHVISDLTQELVIIMTSFLVALWPMWVVAGLLVWLLVRFKLLEKRRPGFLALESEHLVWVGLDGGTEREIPWSDITGVSVEEWAWWRAPIAVFSSLTIYFGQNDRFEIGGYTSRYQHLKAELRRRLDARAESPAVWRSNATSLFRSPQGIVLLVFAGVSVQLLFSIGNFLFVALSDSSNFTKEVVQGLFFILTLLPGSWLGLRWLDRLRVTRPEWRIPYWLLGAGGIILADYFFVPLVSQPVARPSSFVLVALGFWWVTQAGWWIMRPIYVVRVRVVEVTHNQSARLRSGLVLGLLIGSAVLFLRLLLIDVSEYYYLARGFFGTDPQSIHRDLEQAIRLRPDDPWPYYGRSFTLIREERYPEAIDNASSGLEVANGSLPIADMLYYTRGQAYFLTEQYERALDDFHLADQHGVEMYMGGLPTYKVQALIRLGRLVEAEAELKAWAPKSNFDYNNRGELYFRVGNYRLALADFESALSLDPDTTYYVYSRARVLEALGRRDEALAAMAGVQISDAYAYARFGFVNQGQAYMVLGEFDLAEMDLQRAKAIAESDFQSANARYPVDRDTFFSADYWSAWAWSSNMHRRYAEALAATEQALALISKNGGPAYTVIHTQRAIALANLRQEAQSLEEVRLALKDTGDRQTDSPRNYVRARYVRAQIYAMLGEKEHAITDLEWVLREWEFDNLALWEVKDAQKLLAELKGK